MLSVAPSGATAACVVAELVWIAADPDRACEARRRGVRWRLRAGLFASPVSAFAGLVACLRVCLLAIVFVLCIRTAPVAMLTPPQARRSGPGGAATRRRPSTWTAMLPLPGKSRQCEPRQRFFAARQAPSGPQRSWSSTGLFERPKNLHFGLLDEWCWRPESNRQPFAYEATALPIVLGQRMVGARGIEPTMDGLKDRYSAIELYPRVGTRPGIRTPNIFVLSEAPLPVGPAARIGAPGRGRTSNLPVRGRVHGPSCCGRVVVTPEGFEPSAFRLEGESAVQSAGPE